MDFISLHYNLVYKPDIVRAVHQGRPQRQGKGGLVKCGHMLTGGGGKGPCERPQAGTFLYCFSMLCRHSLCHMMPIKVQIVIHLIQFAPQSIIWAGTIRPTYNLLSGWGFKLHDPHINPHGVRVKCPDDVNEQRILTAPAIMLSDHRAVYDAKCGRPQSGVGQMRTPADRGRDLWKGSFLRTSFMDDP